MPCASWRDERQNEKRQAIKLCCLRDVFLDTQARKNYEKGWKSVRKLCGWNRWLWDETNRAVINIQRIILQSNVTPPKHISCTPWENKNDVGWIEGTHPIRRLLYADIFFSVIFFFGVYGEWICCNKNVNLFVMKTFPNEYPWVVKRESTIAQKEKEWKLRPKISAKCVWKKIAAILKNFELKLEAMSNIIT